MSNKSLNRPFHNERGTLSWFPLVILTLILITAVLGLLAHWFLGSTPSATVVSAQPTIVPTAAAQPTVVSNDNDVLLKAIQAKLQSLDLQKLNIGGEVKTLSVNGANVATHVETYRMPELYSYDQLDAFLSSAAAASGATLTGPAQTLDGPTGKAHSLIYAGGKANPVEVDWVSTNKPRICIIIDDAGYQKGVALEALYAFKVPVTCAIIPHTTYSHFLAEDFPQHGVEVMCHLPMEGHDKVPAGAYKEYLKRGMDTTKAVEEVKSGLSDLPNCRGLNNHMGSLATLDLKLMEAVCGELKAQGMFVIDSKTSREAVVGQAAKNVGLPVAEREFFLDNKKTPTEVHKEIRATAAYAKKHGLAVAIGHFNPITLGTLKPIVKKLSDQGYEFVYASEVVHQP